MPRPPRGRLAKLQEGNRQKGRAISVDACVSESYERTDLGLCVDALLKYAPAEAPGI